MSILTFDVSAMRADCDGFGRSAGAFFERKQLPFEDLGRQLERVVAKALREESYEFHWSTRDTRGTHEPLRTIKSTSFRNENVAGTSLRAEIAFDLSGRIEPSGKTAYVDRGGTQVGLFWENRASAAKEFHFDIHGPVAGETLGHPPIHYQNVDGVKELPRLSTPLVHPLDVTEFVLMDLFQAKWRSHREDSRSRSTLGRFLPAQRFRLDTKLEWMRLRVAQDCPLISLLSQPRVPFPLHEVVPTPFATVA